MSGPCGNQKGDEEGIVGLVSTSFCGNLQDGVPMLVAWIGLPCAASYSGWLVLPVMLVLPVIQAGLLPPLFQLCCR